MTRAALTVAVMVPAVVVWLTAWGLTAATERLFPSREWSGWSDE